MNEMIMKSLQGAGLALFFLVLYGLLNTVALMALPQYMYYFAVLHVLLIPYITTFYTLITHYRSRDEERTRQTLMYSLVGSCALVGTYFVFPEPSYYIKLVAMVALPAIAVYLYLFDTK